MRANIPLTRAFLESAVLICKHCGAFSSVQTVEGPFDEGPFHRFFVRLQNGCEFAIEQDLRRSTAHLN